MLFIPSHFFDFISIRLIGVMIPATLPSCFYLNGEGFPLLGLISRHFILQLYRAVPCLYFCAYHTRIIAF
ncbi:hypothetical protein O9993_05395 [Vibrio lentus]|nr:hypothetical protein [Vibrio lentus]